MVNIEVYSCCHLCCKLKTQLLKSMKTFPACELRLESSIAEILKPQCHDYFKRLVSLCWQDRQSLVWRLPSSKGRKYQFYLDIENCDNEIRIFVYETQIRLCTFGMWNYAYLDNDKK